MWNRDAEPFGLLEAAVYVGFQPGDDVECDSYDTQLEYFKREADSEITRILHGPMGLVQLKLDKLLSDLNYLGCLFESLVVRDLRVYAQPHGGRVLHYRDNTGLEVDVIIELADGRWAAIEVKLGSGQVDAGARGLSTFAGRIDRSHYGDPAFLAVVTARGYAYRRPDGILVLPIGTMGP